MTTVLSSLKDLPGGSPEIDLGSIVLEVAQEHYGLTEAREKIQSLKKSGFDHIERAKAIMQDHAYVEEALSHEFERFKNSTAEIEGKQIHMGKVMQALYEQDGDKAGSHLEAFVKSTKAKIEALWLAAHEEYVENYGRFDADTLLGRIVEAADEEGRFGNWDLETARQIAADYDLEYLAPKAKSK